MGKTSLFPVVKIHEEKCINCYACITGCPVKYCMDGSGKKLTINEDLCIGCGNCILVCSHKARYLVDDTDLFINEIKQGQKIVAVVAPAVVSAFPKDYLKLNGWLKKLGVEAFFDVSFGAELTVISYLDHIKKNKPRTVIAQPCPAIVSFIEIYHPELLQFLAPADSPMLHTIKMIREYYPQYRNHKTVVISPCIAKKREFVETGLGDYNVTMWALKNYLQDNKINLDSFTEIDYFGPSAERAVGFSFPGGLMETAERFVPGIRRRTDKVEGVHTIYPYLEEIVELMPTNIRFAQLIDCLNCEKGCNGGPGTGNHKKPKVALENPVRDRREKLGEYHKKTKGDWVYKKFRKILDAYWKPNLYGRTYVDRSANNFIKHPNEMELKGIFEKLRKYKQEDIYDCTSCGYGSCKSMATAIFNKLNKPENCSHYIFALLQEEMKVEELLNLLAEHINSATQLIDGITTIVHDLSKTIDSQSASVEESSKKTESMINSLKNTSVITQNKQEAIKELLNNASVSQESMKETIQSVQSISQSVDGIGSAIKIITAIAANTNLLSMNAAIEAAHAGEAGKGFAVVSNEIRHLSESTRENSRNISQTLKNIIDGIAVTSKQSNNTEARITEMSKEINDFAKIMTNLISTLNNLSFDSGEIITSLNSLKTQSNDVKVVYNRMLEMTNKLRDSMHALMETSKKKETLH